MAEIRKHRPRTTSIGDQVRSIVDTGPRPTTPGQRQGRMDVDDDFDPFFEQEEAPEDEQDAHIDASALVISTTGWVSFGQDAIQQLITKSDSANPSAEHDEAPHAQAESE